MSFSVTPKKLLIIKSNPGGLLTVELFLRNRDWNIKSTTDLSEALNFLVQDKPTFVMVSINHPDSRIHKLSNIASQALNACIIAFTEESSVIAQSDLLSYKADYRLYPPVTGPAVERTAHKFFKDHPGSSLAEEDVDSTKKGKGLSNDLFNSILQMLKKETSTLSGEESNSSAKNESSWSSKKTSRNSPSWLPEQNILKRDSEDIGIPVRGRLTPLEIEKNPRSSKKDSVVFRGVKNVLDRFCIKNVDFLESEPIERSSNVSCIVLECSGGSGYLIAALGKDRRIDEDFIKQIKEHLYYFIWENGETVHDHEIMDLKIKDVSFEKWSLLQAEFFRKSVHDGCEIAMAFFPKKDLNLKFSANNKNNMVPIPIEEVQANIQLDFNLYLHLKANDKFLLYTTRGTVLHADQKERLIVQGITHFHIVTLEIPDFNKYRAQTFLNEKINIFEVMQKETELS